MTLNPKPYTLFIAYTPYTLKPYCGKPWLVKGLLFGVKDGAAPIVRFGVESRVPWFPNPMSDLKTHSKGN